MRTKTENAFLWGVSIFAIVAVLTTNKVFLLFIVEYWAYIAAVGALMALSAVISGLWYHRQGFDKGRSIGYDAGYRHGQGIY